MTSESETDYANDFIFKICCIGDGAVGKTSLIKRFTEGSFNQDYIKTLGAQFSRFEKIIENKDGNGKIRARLFFWDIAGQKDFSFMRPTFYNGAKATIVVYDLTRDDSLEHVPEWIEDITTYCGDIPKVCFANKADLVDVEAYDQAKLKEIVEDQDILDFYFTSAKTGKNVHDAFNYIIDLLVEDALKEQQKEKEG